ncbi:uncharacterized protein LOC118743691 [Rhagoletis pomonella]|uniref:uncharacterized protein LOC118743691 n=1 Tax=Rhagoletis pomonella TaxID=28610 RepID=UPI00177FC189|nr:uncharacterized protein LOC118743691 [Rhagoletis pomonella]
MTVKLLSFSFSFSLVCLLIAKSLLLSEAASITWGQQSKYASTIYDEEIQITDANPAVEITYPEKGCIDCNDYTIVAMHAFDMQTPPLRATADGESINKEVANSTTIEVLRGGIGFNYTTIRFQKITKSANQLPVADKGDKPVDNESVKATGRRNVVRAHYQFVIYGVSI